MQADWQVFGLVLAAGAVIGAAAAEEWGRHAKEADARACYGRGWDAHERLTASILSAAVQLMDDEAYRARLAAEECDFEPTETTESAEAYLASQRRTA